MCALLCDKSDMEYSSISHTLISEQLKKNMCCWFCFTIQVTQYTSWWSKWLYLLTPISNILKVCQLWFNQMLRSMTLILCKTTILINQSSPLSCLPQLNGLWQWEQWIWVISKWLEPLRLHCEIIKLTGTQYKPYSLFTRT